MLKINLTFNIIFILISLRGLFMQSLQSIQNCNKITCLISFIYFSYDTYSECIIYKRYTFVPHHFFSILLAYKFYFLKNTYLIENGPMLLLCSEGTSFIVNFRTLLINNKKLTTKIDILLFIIYILTRNLLLTPILYKEKNKHYLIWYSWVCILIMSNIWSIMWIKSIIKYYNKNKKLKAIKY